MEKPGVAGAAIEHPLEGVAEDKARWRIRSAMTTWLEPGGAVPLQKKKIAVENFVRKNWTNPLTGAFQ